MIRHILITGCSSGIGLESACILRERGYGVFASARRQEDVARLVDEGFAAVQLDVACSGSIETALNTVLGQSGGALYALFNNAGYGVPGAVEDLSRDALREQFETNLFGPFELIGRVMPVMRRQGFGRIIQNSSVLGFAAASFRGAYNGSKFAMEGMSDTMRLELAGSNIHISLIEPGPITSRFRQNSYKAFQRHIKPDTSCHKAVYEQMEKRFQQEGAVFPFTLPASAVVDKLIHALESPRPRARYYVTVPTYLLGYLKRVLPTFVMDRIILAAFRSRKKR